MISTVPSLTDSGKALLMRAITGEAITFTRIAIGSGELEEGQDPDELTHLIAEEISMVPCDVDTSQQGLVIISGDFTSADVLQDFVWRELGVYAQGEDAVELLYAYSNDGDAAGTLRALTTTILTEQTIRLVIQIGDAEDAGAIYNPHTQYAEAAVLTGHMNNKHNPHAVTKEQVGLGNVPNKSPENVTVEYEEAAERVNIISGEKLSLILGKIKKYLSDIDTHIATAQGNPHGVCFSDIAEAGTYVGDGEQGRTISLSDDPAAVLVYDEFGQTYNAVKGVCGGLALSGRGVRIPASQTTSDATTWSDSFTALMCVDNGFKVNYLSGQTDEDSINTNESGVVYHYIAWK